jgi:type I restriction enzyme S subunit
MTEWRDVTFSDVLGEPLRNGVYKSKEFHGRGVKVVNMKELFAHDRISDQPDSRVELTPGELSRFGLRDGDLLFARRSFVFEGAGKCGLVVDPTEDTTFESSMIRARVDAATADPVWVYYFFRSSQGRSLMASIATRTAVSGISGTNLAALLLWVPDLPAQHRIANILGTYDELIENNTRRIEILEEMARAIYREWFVDFRYPGRPSELGGDSSTPPGWRRGTLDELAVDVKESVEPGSADVDTPYFGLEHLPRRSLAETEWSTAEVAGSRKFAFKQGDILFGRIRPYFHKVAVPPVAGICSTDAMVIRPRDSDAYAFLVATLSSDAVTEYATRTSQGTKMPRTSWAVLQSFPVSIPTDDLSKQFGEFMLPALAQMRTLTLMNRNLAAQRDLLLPRLVSGEIDVSTLDVGTSRLAS